MCIYTHNLYTHANMCIFVHTNISIVHIYIHIDIYMICIPIYIIVHTFYYINMHPNKHISHILYVVSLKLYIIGLCIYLNHYCCTDANGLRFKY